jgi:glycine/D-amino acid oxidase-like deaminating enzyme
MGHLVVMDDSPEQLALTAFSLELWHELRRSAPAAVEYDPCGTIWVAADDSQMDAVAAKHQLYEEHGIPAELLTRGRLAQLEPNLRSDLTGGLLVQGDAVLYAPRAALWLLERARSKGAVLREHRAVNEIASRSVRCGESVIHADVIVNAAGAEAATLTPELPIVPRKGHLAITDRYPGFCRHQLVELGYLTSAHEMTSESVAFNVQPRSTGQLLVGSSRELVGWNAGTNRNVLRQMMERAHRFMPALSQLSVIRTWTGFRPATPDKLPLIGPWSPTPGLWVAAGHEGLGITTSLGTARILADLVTGRRPPIDATPFSPARLRAAATA